MHHHRKTMPGKTRAFALYFTVLHCLFIVAKKQKAKGKRKSGQGREPVHISRYRIRKDCPRQPACRIFKLKGRLSKQEKNLAQKEVDDVAEGRYDGYKKVEMTCMQTVWTNVTWHRSFCLYNRLLADLSFVLCTQCVCIWKDKLPQTP